MTAASIPDTPSHTGRHVHRHYRRPMMNNAVPPDIAAELDALFAPKSLKPAPHPPSPAPEPLVSIKSADEIVAEQPRKVPEPDEDPLAGILVPPGTPGSTNYSAETEHAAYIERTAIPGGSGPPTTTSGSTVSPEMAILQQIREQQEKALSMLVVLISKTSNGGKSR